MAKPGNILVITTDQHRYDANGFAGNPLCRTPNIDGLADRGQSFSNAYSVCALCTPARASMFTGMYPHNHGLIRNSEDPFCRTEFGSSDRLVSQDLREQGYACAFVGKWHCGIQRLPSDFGFEGMDVPGYGKCRETREYGDYLRKRGLSQGEIRPVGGGWQPNTILAGVDTGPVEASVPYFLAEQTIEKLHDLAARDRPFLLFTNFWGPHAPYFPTEPYASMYSPAAMEPWGNFDESFVGKPNAHRRYRDAFVGEGNSPRVWEDCAPWVALYYGFTTMIDAQIGRILSALDELGLADETTVIFTTDHGDLLGAHGGMHDKCSIMCQETYHIPFVVSLPGGPSGAVLRQPITNMDLAPTLMDLAGVPSREGLDGRSLLPLLRSEGDVPWEEDAYCEFNGHHYHYQARMVTDGKHRYVFNAPEIDELYDLETDPWEMNNRIAEPEHADLADHMRERLLYWAEKNRDPLLGWMRNIFLPRQREYSPYGGSYKGKP